MTDQIADPGAARGLLRADALRSALQKRGDGVPTYTVAEAAALLSISQEYLYRLIQAGAFPAVRMRLTARQGRYVVPAKALEQLLSDASAAGTCVDSGDSVERSQSETPGGK